VTRLAIESKNLLDPLPAHAKGPGHGGDRDTFRARLRHLLPKLGSELVGLRIGGREARSESLNPSQTDVRVSHSQSFACPDEPPMQRTLALRRQEVEDRARQRKWPGDAKTSRASAQEVESPMHEQPTTAVRKDESDEAANLVDALFGLVTERRTTLSYDERHELKMRVSDRVRELVPYVETEGYHHRLDSRIEKMASGYNRAAVLAREPGSQRARTLTQLECDITTQMLLGKTDAEAALVLGVSKATVSKYALIAVRKLGATNRVHAVARIFAAVTSDEATVGKSSLYVAGTERYNMRDSGNHGRTPGRGSDVTEAPDLPFRPQADSGASA
jgi:DNA-binding CsgD family transcriptional regulator